MEMNSNALLESLQSDVRTIILKAGKLEMFSKEILEKQPTPEKWSVAQVLHHLNIYSRFYINAIEHKMHLHQTTPRDSFTPGWLGNYFTKLMRPATESKVGKKMKAPKNAIPAAQPDSKAMLQEFLQHQNHLLNLLEIAKSISLDIRIPTSLSRLITLKLGDTFRFFIAHQHRHFVQIANVISGIA